MKVNILTEQANGLERKLSVELRGNFQWNWTKEFVIHKCNILAREN